MGDNDLRQRASEAALTAWNSMAAVCEHTQMIPVADLVDAVLAVQNDELERLRDLIRDLTDPDPCWFDHHGGCQAHGYLSLKPGERCPHAEAKELLSAEEQTGGGNE